MKTRILLYHSYLSEMGGTDTFIYNFCYLFNKDYDITLLYCGGKRKRINIMKKLVKLVRYNENKEYDTDIYIRNSVWGIIPTNIKYKYGIEIRHADYNVLLKQGVLFKQYKPSNIENIIGVSNWVSKMSNKVLGDDPKTLYNPVLPRFKTKKVYHFISFMRINKNKGLERMNIFYNKLKEANIPFEWNIFTNSNYKSNVDEIHFWKARVELKDYIDYLVDSDYTVLLSDSEGCPYQVLESLSYNIPVIATDIPAIHELIEDGKNGYIIPLDMNFDIKRILKIPEYPYINNVYKNNEEWRKYLSDIERKLQNGL